MYSWNTCDGSDEGPGQPMWTTPPTNWAKQAQFQHKLAFCLHNTLRQIAPLRVLRLVWRCSPRYSRPPLLAPYSRPLPRNAARSMPQHPSTAGEKSTRNLPISCGFCPMEPFAPTARKTKSALDGNWTLRDDSSTLDKAHSGKLAQTRQHRHYGELRHLHLVIQQPNPLSLSSLFNLFTPISS